MLLEILECAGVLALFILAVWVIYSATEVIEGVNEPGLYSKLKEEEECDEH